MNADLIMDAYERDLVTELARIQRTSTQEAEGTVARYLHVLRHLGRYPSPEDMAQSLQRILDKGWTPDQWEEHIRKIDRVEQKRKGLSEFMNATPHQKDEILELKQEILELQQKVSVLANTVSRVEQMVPLKTSTRTASKRSTASYAARALSGSSLSQRKASHPAPKRAGAHKRAVKS
jgi:uncharacterized protein YoxC